MLGTAAIYLARASRGSLPGSGSADRHQRDRSGRSGKNPSGLCRMRRRDLHGRCGGGQPHRRADLAGAGRQGGLGRDWAGSRSAWRAALTGRCVARSRNPHRQARIRPRAAVAQLARASACHAEGRGFESHQPLFAKARSGAGFPRSGEVFGKSNHPRISPPFQALVPRMTPMRGD
jgi:hypothetical protein